LRCFLKPLSETPMILEAPTRLPVELINLIISESSG
jgi:hypothetical protein